MSYRESNRTSRLAGESAKTLAQFAEAELQRKRRTSIVLSFAGFVVSLVACVAAFSLGLHFRGWITAGVALISGVALLLLRRTRKPDLINVPALSGIAVFTLYLLITGGTDNSGVVWVAISPPMLLFTLGVRRGGALALVFLLAVVVILFFPGDRLLLTTYSLDFKVRVLPAILFVSAISFVFERARMRVQARYEIEILERQRAEREAEDANRAKSAFLAKISHEIRTPLNGVLGFASLLSNELPECQQRGRVEAIIRSGEHLKTLFDELLDLAAVEAGHLRLDPKPIDLRTLANDVVELLKPQAAEKGLIASCEVTPDMPHLLRADERRLRQVLLNLLSNAIKFTQRGSVRLFLECLESEDPNSVRVAISVSDTGPGVRPEDRERVFERFWQGPEVAGSAAGGVGLGLFICREIVTAMGGRISVMPTKGSGASFRVELKLDRVKDEPDSCIAPETTPPAIPPGVRVLVADDDPSSRYLLAAMLSQMGITVDVVGDGQEVVDMASAGHYDAILMDCKMPRLDGYEATRRIRAQEKRAEGIPIVAVTAGVFAEENATCLAAGMTAVLAKPVDPASLRQILARVLPARVLPARVLPARVLPDVGAQ